MNGTILMSILVYQRIYSPGWLRAALFVNAIFAAAAFGFVPPAKSAELRVISGGGAQQILRTLVPKFESVNGDKVELNFSVVGAIQQKLAAGEKGDVLILPATLLDGLEKAGVFRTQSRTPLGQIGIGIAVRESATTPDVSTPEAFRQLLLEGRSFVFPDPKLTPSGGHLLRVFAQMGIAEKMQPKLTFRNAIDGGINLVRDGQVEIGLFLVTEILPVKGVRLAGSLPPSLQSHVVYVAAIAADSGASDRASALVRFLSDPGVREHWTAAGFESPGNGN
jgi:molybdate transport system substrate-binding protein